MRDIKRIPFILERLRTTWEKHPDLRLGQLIVIAAKPTQPCTEIFHVEDERLLEGLVKYQATSGAVEQEVEVILGPETDDLLRSKIRKATAAMGGTVRETSWGVGGSQEVISYEIALPHGRLALVSETYIGLLLRGKASLVSEFTHAVQSA